MTAEKDTKKTYCKTRVRYDIIINIMSRNLDFERKCVETLAEKNIFEKTKYFIVDMDGTFYLDGNIIPGADGFLKKSPRERERLLFLHEQLVEQCRLVQG